MFFYIKCKLKGHNINECSNELKCRLCNKYGHQMPWRLNKSEDKQSETEGDKQ